MGKPHEILYSLLRLPYSNSAFKSPQSNDYLHLGAFIAKDVEGGIEAITSDYLKHAKRYQDIVIRSSRVNDLIQDKQWITFEQYKRLASEYKSQGKQKRQSNMILNEESRQQKIEMVEQLDPFERISISARNKQILQYHFDEVDTPTVETYFDILIHSNISIGKFLKSKIPLFIPEKQRRLNTYISGSIGSGKSELIKTICRHYIRSNDCSVVVIDPTSKLSSEIARFREFRPDSPFFDRLIYIDPFLKDGHTPCLNPFQLEDRNEKIINTTCQEITKSFEQLLKGSTWSVQMEALLNPCISTLMRMEKPTSLFDLQDFMDNDDDLINEGIESPNKAHRNFFSDRFVNNKNYEPTKSSIYTKLQYLNSYSDFDRLINGVSSFDLEAALNSKKIILFNLSSGDLGQDVSSAFGALLVAMIQSIAHKRTSFTTKKYDPIHLFIDECQNYITSSIEKILTESRKFRLHLTLASQVLGQKMTSELKDIVQETTRIKLQGMGFKEPYSELQTGEFYCKVGNGKLVRFKGDDACLDSRNAMTSREWEEVKQFQLKNYYQPIEQDDKRETREKEAHETENKNKPTENQDIEDFL